MIHWSAVNFLNRCLVSFQSYTGVELLRVLVANDVGPILMIAFTNHALDHMLCSVLDAGITTDIVRLGSRASEERIAEYSIETREMAAGQSRLKPASTSKYHELQSVGQEITKLIKSIREIDFESDSSEIRKYISLAYPEHHVFFSAPPSWINVAKGLLHDGDSEGGKWQKQGRRGQVLEEDTSLYAFWRDCGDFEFLAMITAQVISNARQEKSSVEPGPSNRFEFLTTEPTEDTEDTDSEDEDDASSDGDNLEMPLWMTAGFSMDDDESGDSPEVWMTPNSSNTSNSVVGSDEAEDVTETRPSYVHDTLGFFKALGEDNVPVVPLGDRDLDALLDAGDVWAMSRYERQTLHAFWIEKAREEWQQNQQGEFERLRKKHAEKVQEHNEIKEEVCRARLAVYFPERVFW